MNINDLIAALQSAAAAGVTAVNFNDVDQPSQTPAVEELPETDFEVGDEVLVCHLKKDGTGSKHTTGTVVAIQQQDDKGWYTRIDGDNGCHYRTGLKLNEERRGSKVIGYVDAGGDLVTVED